MSEMDKGYESEDGHTIAREQGMTPNGNNIGGRWVLRAPDGSFLDVDQYRFDLAARNGFETTHENRLAPIRADARRLPSPKPVVCDEAGREVCAGGKP